MQQLGVGATLDAHGNSVKQVNTCTDKKKVSGFQVWIFCPPLTRGGCAKYGAAAHLVCNDVQLYDTPGSGSGLLADDVEHFAHQFLNRDTHGKRLTIHLVYCI